MDQLRHRRDRLPERARLSELERNLSELAANKAAVAIVAGRAGEHQFTDAAVRDPVVVALRDRVETAVDPSLTQDQARVKIRLKDGRVLERFVPHAVGSVEVPMTDAQLDAKFSDLVSEILPADRTGRLLTLCRGVEHLDDAGDIARAAAAA